jgi:hypothetical protein
VSDRDWEKVIGRLVIYRKGWRWTVLWRSGTYPVPGYTFRALIDMNRAADA